MYTQTAPDTNVCACVLVVGRLITHVVLPQGLHKDTQMAADDYDCIGVLVPGKLLIHVVLSQDLHVDTQMAASITWLSSSLRELGADQKPNMKEHKAERSKSRNPGWSPQSSISGEPRPDPSDHT